MSPARIRIGIALLIAAATAQAQERGAEHPLGTLREQAQVQQQWLEQRLETVLPGLMREHGVALWIVAMREYNEDPVFRALVSPTCFAARRRTIFVFHDRGPSRGIERLALGGSSQGGLYRAIRGKKVTAEGRRQELLGAEQWRLLAATVRERDPRTIAVNISAAHNFADGLSAGEWEQMQKALGPEFLPRVIRAERLPIDYLHLRVPGMLSSYRRMQELAWGIIATAFSSEVITPGKTTTADVVWWMRQRINALGLQTWFQPTVDVQRRGGVERSGASAPPIERGDVLHCDIGLSAMGLNSDTQHMGYVLLAGETEVPAGLRAALLEGNRLQDILIAEMRPGRTGNEVLRSALVRMRELGIDGTIYSHPVGDHGHAAGPLIGLWDHQEGVPVRGDLPLRPSTWYAIELQATTAVPGWGGQRVRIGMEEDAELTPAGTMRWILRRQVEFHLVH